MVVSAKAGPPAWSGDDATCTRRSLDDFALVYADEQRTAKAMIVLRSRFWRWAEPIRYFELAPVGNDGLCQSFVGGEIITPWRGLASLERYARR